MTNQAILDVVAKTVNRLLSYLDSGAEVCSPQFAKEIINAYEKARWQPIKELDIRDFGTHHLLSDGKNCRVNNAMMEAILCKNLEDFINIPNLHYCEIGALPDLKSKK